MNQDKLTKEQYEKINGWAHGSTGPDKSDMLYRSYIDGPQGAKYELMKENHHSNEDITKAKSFLRRSFDVVSIHIISEIEILNG